MYRPDSLLADKTLLLAGQSARYRHELQPVLREIRRSAAMTREALRQKQFLRMMGQGGSFGVISAYGKGSKRQNQIRHGELIADLSRLGARWTPLRGSWDGVTEKSVLVRDIDPEELFFLGRKYHQEAVIYKSRDGVVGMYYTRGFPRAEIAVDPQGDPVFEAAADEHLFSKARGLSFSLGFLWGRMLPWDGLAPVSRKQMRRFVQKEFASSYGERDVA